MENKTYTGDIREWPDGVYHGNPNFQFGSVLTIIVRSGKGYSLASDLTTYPIIGALNNSYIRIGDENEDMVHSG